MSFLIKASAAAFCASEAIATLTELQYYYAGYIAMYSKNYQTIDEFHYRMGLFDRTSELIRNHNTKGASHSFYLGHNQFSDMTQAEKRAYLGYHQPLSTSTSQKHLEYTILEDNYGNSLDWRAKGVVGPIRDEGSVC